MEALVITLREGTEAALIIGLILAYLNRTGRAALNHYVYVGLVLAVAASIAGALILSLLGLDPENEVLEGTLLAVAAVLVVTLALWMWRASQSLKRHVETRLEALAAEAAPRRRQGLALTGLAFFMVFREGVETVLFLAALSLTAADALLQLIGATVGLGLAVLFGFLLIKGSLRLDLRCFFGLTSLVLLILVARLLAGSVHEFAEVGMLPTTPALLAIVGFVVKDSTSIVILIALVLLPALAMLPGLSRLPAEEDARLDERPVDRRRRVAASRQARRWQMAVIALTLAVALPLAWAVYTAETAGFRPVPVEVVPQGDDIRIGTAMLELARLHKFVHHGPRADVRFMVIKRGEGDLAVALDACNICPPVGYYQEGDTIICDNCNAPINLSTIGVPGGCNPIPLPFSLQGGDVVIRVSDIEAAQGRFLAAPRSPRAGFAWPSAGALGSIALSATAGAHCPLPWAVGAGALH